MKNKILVVDDEGSIREALIKVLKEEDYEVVSAEKGLEAIERLESEKIDLLLLDLGLPAKDGRDIMIWLAQINPILPVIIITGRSNQRELAVKLGADALMDKPLDVPQLLQTVRELINTPVELRAHRDASRFQHLPCDHELFLKLQRERFTAPYVWKELENH
jgi:DNA-binding response OmpR family regulator